jgi:hypothetical protein
MKDKTRHDEGSDTFLGKAPLFRYLNDARAYYFAPSTRLSSSQAGRSAYFAPSGRSAYFAPSGRSACFAPFGRSAYFAPSGRNAPLRRLRQGEKIFWTEH